MADLIPITIVPPIGPGAPIYGNPAASPSAPIVIRDPFADDGSSSGGGSGGGGGRVATVPMGLNPDSTSAWTIDTIPGIGVVRINELTGQWEVIIPEAPNPGPDANRDGYDDRTGLPNGAVAVPTSMSPTGILYQGKPVNPDGSLYVAPPKIPEPGQVTYRTLEDGSTVAIVYNPDGTFSTQTVIAPTKKMPTTSGSGGGGGYPSGAASSGPSVAEQAALYAKKAQADIAVIQARAELERASRDMASVEAARDRAFQAGEAEKGRQFQLQLQQMQQEFQSKQAELDRAERAWRMRTLEIPQVRAGLARQVADLVSSTDPLAFKAFLAAGGGNIANALATGGTAVSDNANLGAARTWQALDELDTAMNNYPGVGGTTGAGAAGTGGTGTPGGGGLASGGTATTPGTGTAVAGENPVTNAIVSTAREEAGRDYLGEPDEQLLTRMASQYKAKYGVEPSAERLQEMAQRQMEYDAYRAWQRNQVVSDIEALDPLGMKDPFLSNQHPAVPDPFASDAMWAAYDQAKSAFRTAMAVGPQPVRGEGRRRSSEVDPDYLLRKQLWDAYTQPGTAYNNLQGVADLAKQGFVPDPVAEQQRYEQQVAYHRDGLIPTREGWRDPVTGQVVTPMPLTGAQIANGVTQSWDPTGPNYLPPGAAGGPPTEATAPGTGALPGPSTTTVTVPGVTGGAGGTQIPTEAQALRGGIYTNVPRMAMGGLSRAPMAVVGDPQVPGRPNPEVILNPTNAPISVVPMNRMGGLARHMPHFAYGTDDRRERRRAQSGGLYATTTAQAPATGAATPTTTTPTPTPTPVATQPAPSPAPVPAPAPVSTGGLSTPPATPPVPPPAAPVVDPTLGIQNPITDADRPYLDKVAALRNSTEIPDISIYDVGFANQLPTIQQLYLRGMQSKYGVPVDDLMAEYQRYKLGGLSRGQLSLGY